MKLAQSVLLGVTLMGVGFVQSWSQEARMAGMGTPVGILSDKSDFKTHPSLLADIHESNGYVDYDYADTDVTSEQVNATGAGTGTAHLLDLGGGGDWNVDGSGHDHANSVHAGYLMPLSRGTFAVVADYSRGEGYFPGSAMEGVPITFFDRTHNENYALTFSYGAKLNPNSAWGAEFKLSHIDHSLISTATSAPHTGDTNFAFGDSTFSFNQFGMPVDAKYYRADGKVSWSGKAGANSWSLTANGGTPVSSKNEYRQSFFGGAVPLSEMYGDVKGYSGGANLWFRHRSNGRFSFPAVLSTDLSLLTLYGNSLSGVEPVLTQEHSIRARNVIAGGGVDLDADKTKIGVGIFYGHLYSDDSQYTTDDSGLFQGYAYMQHFPQVTENRMTAKIGLERPVSDNVVLRGGLEEYAGSENLFAYFINSGLMGTAPISHMITVSQPNSGWNTGFGPSLGASIHAGCVFVEPFVSAELHRMYVSGNNWSTIFDTPQPRTGDWSKDDNSLRAGVTVRWGGAAAKGK